MIQVNFHKNKAELRFERNPASVTKLLYIIKTILKFKIQTYSQIHRCSHHGRTYRIFLIQHILTYQR